jgi:hypothetical protein
MPKTVEEKLNSALLIICKLKAELQEAEGIIQAHSLARQWRQSSEIAKYWASQEVTATMRHSGSQEKTWQPCYDNANALANEPPKREYGLCGYRVEPRIMVNDATAFNFKHMPSPDYDFSKLEEQIATTMGVPSEFIGADMADGPGTHAEIEARMEEGNIILSNLSYGKKPTSHSFATPEEPPKPKHTEDSLFEYLIGLDPNCVLSVWMEQALLIAKVYDKNIIGGIKLLHDWSSGKLGGHPTPYSYSEQSTNCVWATLTGEYDG